MGIKVEAKYTANFIGKEELKNHEAIVKVAAETVINGTGAGSDFLGWKSVATNQNEKELLKISRCSDWIKENAEVLIVIGIGGSYLGSRAALEFCYGPQYNEFLKTKVYFAGQNISSDYLSDLEKIIKGKDFVINVISKSGTTLEPALAFRFFKNLAIKKYGAEGANKRIFATTDGKNGKLYEMAKMNKWERFVVPDNIGGRFSVLTPVGLLPIAVGGIDITEVLDGAKLATKELLNANVASNPALTYASLRNILNAKGFEIELSVVYEPRLQMFQEWWKQLFGESEGKNKRGIFPASVVYSTDLHSLGQIVQDGKRNLFETVWDVKRSSKNIKVEKDVGNCDKLNYLAGKNFNYINHVAELATIEAHVEGGVPNIILAFEKCDAKTFGYLTYFFMYSCAVSGYVNAQNPFDQPGVENYKTKMFQKLK